jgi:hypothetical protein
MHAIRFNPVLEQWVLLGEAIPESLAHLSLTKHQVFPGNTEWHHSDHPRSPFVIDAPRTGRHHHDLIVAEHAAIGEYDLLTYAGDKSVGQWEASEWELWLSAIAMRFQSVKQNHALHYCGAQMRTKGLASTGPDQLRVADCIATSHKISGAIGSLDAVLVEKITTKEGLFVVRKQDGMVCYVPSAPTHRNEVWLLSTNPDSGVIHHDSKKSLHGCAQMLTQVYKALDATEGKPDWVVTIHSDLQNTQGRNWWIQIHQDDAGALAMVHSTQNPERLVAYLNQSLPR